MRLNCKDCRFAVERQAGNYGYNCKIVMPKGYEISGRNYVWGDDSCDLGQPREQTEAVSRTDDLSALAAHDAEVRRKCMQEIADGFRKCGNDSVSDTTDSCMAITPTPPLAAP